MDLEKYIVLQIKRVADENYGMASRIAEAAGVERGTVSNRLKGIRSSDETFRRTAAEVAGLDYDEIVSEYYRQYPKAGVSFGDHGSAGAINQADVLNINNNHESPTETLIPEMVVLCRQIAKRKNPDEICMRLLRELDKYD